MGASHWHVLFLCAELRRKKVAELEADIREADNVVSKSLKHLSLQKSAGQTQLSSLLTQIAVAALSVSARAAGPDCILHLTVGTPNHAALCIDMCFF